MFLQRTQKQLFYLVLLSLSVFILFPALFVVFASHLQLLHHIFWNKPQDLNLLWFSWTLKVISWILVFYLVLSWKDAFGEQKNAIVRFCLYLSKVLYQIIEKNKGELMGIDKSARMSLFFLLLVQVAFYFYYLCQTPLQFDEWYSYYFFSSDSLWKTMTYYPVPNNHIFSNLISGVFMMMPFDPEIMIRLPSLIASLFCTYYFFKLAKNTFNPGTALILVSLILIIFPFVTFSIQARGYSFVNLFVVLAMYASQKLSQEYRNVKYRFLFVISLFLGLYSVPSFLYPALFICAVLAVYVLLQERKKNFLLFSLDGMIVGVLTLLMYALILCFNDPQLLLNPNGGSTKFSIHDADAWHNIIIHLKLTFYYFFRFNALILSSVIISAGAMYFIITEKKERQYTIILSMVIFLSPLIILPTHQVRPFERTWLYLLFPCFLCLGALVYKFSNFSVGNHINRRFFHALIITACILILPNYSIWQKEQNMTDYQLMDLRKGELRNRISSIKQIGFTYTNIEYYMAHQFLCFCRVENKNKVMQFSGLDSIKNQDLLLIDQSLLSKFRTGLTNYDSLTTISEAAIYIRKGPVN